MSRDPARQIHGDRSSPGPGARSRRLRDAVEGDAEDGVNGLVERRELLPDRHDFIERMNGSPATWKETSGLPGHAVLGSLQ